MASSQKHRWTFQPRFRRNAFGWRSQPAVKRVNEAVAEIRKEAKNDLMRAAEGGGLRPPTRNPSECNAKVLRREFTSRYDRIYTSFEKMHPVDLIDGFSSSSRCVGHEGRGDHKG
jgi:hypothetical protein